MKIIKINLKNRNCIENHENCTENYRNFTENHENASKLTEILWTIPEIALKIT